MTLGQWLIFGPLELVGAAVLSFVATGGPIQVYRLWKMGRDERRDRERRAAMPPQVIRVPEHRIVPLGYRWSIDIDPESSDLEPTTRQTRSKS